MSDTPAAPTPPEAIYAEHRKCGPKYEGCYSHFTFMDHCRADGMAWPCDVSRLARSTPAESLDVERLLDRVIVALHCSEHPDTNYETCAICPDFRLAIAPIRAEYARSTPAEALDGLDARESWQSRQALARRLNFEAMDAIRSRSADAQTAIRHGTASQPVMDREALIRYIDWLVTHARLSRNEEADHE